MTMDTCAFTANPPLNKVIACIIQKTLDMLTIVNNIFIGYKNTVLSTIISRNVKHYDNNKTAASKGLYV